MKYQVVIQLSSADFTIHKGMLDQISNLLNDLDDIKVEVVVHEEAYPFLLENSYFNLHVLDLQKRAVQFYVCENTMNAQHLIKSDFIPEVEMVSSGVAHIVKRQSEGWAYLKAGF